MGKPGRPCWEPDYDKIEYLVNQGYNVRDICRICNVSPNALYMHRKTDKRLDSIMRPREEMRTSLDGVAHGELNPIGPISAVADLKDNLQRAGIDPKFFKDLLKNRANLLERMPDDLQDGGDSQLSASLRDKIWRIVGYLTDVEIAAAPIKDKMVALDVMFKALRLLEDRPTQIMSYEERKELNELVPALIEEAKRRGIAVDSSIAIDGESTRH